MRRIIQLETIKEADKWLKTNTKTTRIYRIWAWNNGKVVINYNDEPIHSELIEREFNHYD